MGLLAMKLCCSSKPGNFFPAHGLFGRKIDLYSSPPNLLPAISGSGFRADTRVFARKRWVKKSRRPNSRPNKPPSGGNNNASPRKDDPVQDSNVVPSIDNKFVDASPREDDHVQDNNVVPSLDHKFMDVSPREDDSVQEKNPVPSLDNLVSRTKVAVSSRSSVLQACTVTSGLFAGLGVLIREVSHYASTEGWPVIDCSSELSFSFEMWHLEVITGLVILISSCRFVLLKTWPDFAESSDAANQQVLTNLQPLDYLVVACLPGFSEELLFRGALFPLFGNEWKSAVAVALLFGVLHLGSGRKYSFAIWATFVGLAYAYGTVLSSSIVVPMASHAVNNLVGGVMWRYTSKSTK